MAVPIINLYSLNVIIKIINTHAIIDVYIILFSLKIRRLCTFRAACLLSILVDAAILKLKIKTRSRNITSPPKWFSVWITLMKINHGTCAVFTSNDVFVDGVQTLLIFVVFPVTSLLITYETLLWDKDGQFFLLFF